MSQSSELILTGDIGGTKTALAIFSRKDGPGAPLAKATFASKEFASLEAIVQGYLTSENYKLARAVFGIAGPVSGGRAHVTNLPWTVDSQSLKRVLAVPVELLNDLESIAHGIPFLDKTDLATLNPGQAAEHGALAVIAPGTGLGEAFLAWDGTRYRPHASEGGHTDYGPTTETEIDLLKFLMPRFGHVSYERVCSGIGIPNLYTFLLDTGRAVEPEWLRQSLAGAADPTPIIVDAAVDNKADICRETLDLFLSILGSEAGNLALKVMATGGVYVAGGIPPRILPQLQSGTFMQSFCSKGRFKEVLSRIPIHVVLHPEAGLFGMACYGLLWEGPRTRDD